MSVHIRDLPRELHDMIGSYIDYFSLQNLFAASRYFRSLRRETFWKQRLSEYELSWLLSRQYEQMAAQKYLKDIIGQMNTIKNKRSFYDHKMMVASLEKELDVTNFSITYTKLLGSEKKIKKLEKKRNGIQMELRDLKKRGHSRKSEFDTLSHRISELTIRYDRLVPPAHHEYFSTTVSLVGLGVMRRRGYLIGGYGPGQPKDEPPTVLYYLYFCQDDLDIRYEACQRHANNRYILRHLEVYIRSEGWTQDDFKKAYNLPFNCLIGY